MSPSFPFPNLFPGLIMRVQFHAVALAVGMSISTTAIVDAQPARSIQPVPAPRALGPIVARAAQSFQDVNRVLIAGGSVFVNDATSRQLWMFDANLSRGKTVLDSTGGTGSPTWYGQSMAPSALRRFRGDSVLFARAGAVEGIILGANGGIARVAAMPQGIACGFQDMDATGWLACQMPPRLPTVPPKPTLADGRDSVVRLRGADSAVVAVVGFKTWDVDTIARLAAAPQERIVTFRQSGLSNVPVSWPIYLSDLWAISRDGTLGIARAVDYHIDIVDLRGKVTPGPRAPFAWRRLTDVDKDVILDSLRRTDSVSRARQDSVIAARVASGAMPASVTSVASPLRASPDEWPSYWPPFALGATAMLADEDGRFWVRERLPRGGDTVKVYGVFDTKGQFVDRVQFPAAQSIAGFGPGGAVYLTTLEGGRVVLHKAKFR